MIFKQHYLSSMFDIKCVTFVVYTVSHPYGGVSAAFWATLRSVTFTLS